MTTFASSVQTTEAVLVHDISAPHPRYAQLARMAAEVAASTHGALTIAINPGGKVRYPGLASLDEVRSRRVPLGGVNSAFLQSVDPDLAFINLPFTVNDELMGRSGVAQALIGLVQHYLEPRGLKTLAIMRGADTIFISRDRQVRTPDDLKGLKIRVAGPGVYQAIVKSLGAEPVIFPAIEMAAALARGAMDGIITSPGGWRKNVQNAPHGSLVPGLLFYTYFLIADKVWFDALPAAHQDALCEAARAEVTDKWSEMREDDARLVAQLVAKGAAYSAVPANELVRWTERTADVTKAFAASHPEIMQRLGEIVGGNRDLRSGYS